MTGSGVSWAPIVVGVDESREAAAAAALGWRLARAAGTSCHLVHAVRDPGTAPLPSDAGLAARIGSRLREALADRVPREALATLGVRPGRPACVLRAEVARVGAGLVILGGAHDRAAARWRAGRVARDAVRLLAVPVLVTRGAPATFHRVLAAVDLSFAARATLREAERWAQLAGAALRAMHVLEPLPGIASAAHWAEQQRVNAASLAALERRVWPLLRLPHAERAVEAGDAAATLAAEAARWGADLLVVGSHGQGWVGRELLGETTERLLDELPASLLVVPVRKPALPAARPHGARPAAAALRLAP
jgi:nucleotide-binding universal stress UspA family protein